MKLILASKRGFCSGVRRSLAVMDEVLKKYSPPIYGYHDIVHNQHVIEQLQKKGVIFVDDIDLIPKDATVVFSAHGVGLDVYQKAKAKGLTIFDATCPRVKKIHLTVQKASQEAVECIVIGYLRHAETRGIVGQYTCKNRNIIVIESLNDISELHLTSPETCICVMQTTFPVNMSKILLDALKEKFPKLQANWKYHCTVVEDRQRTVKNMTKQVNSMVILGSQTSSNAKALKAISEQENIPTYLVDTPSQLKTSWFLNLECVGVATSASAPEILVTQTVQWFQHHFKSIHIVS